MDWTTTAFVFPGQGSQSVGMGRDLAAAYPLAAHMAEQADNLLEMPLSARMFDGDEATLAQTIYTQPAMFVSSLMMLRVLQSLAPQAVPAMVAGHSLGELSAVVASGALTFEDGLSLVKQRARLMQLAGEQSQGGMAAILNLPFATLADVCQQASDQSGQAVVIANDNCPGQIVISGDEAALTLAMELAKAAGAKRALRLNVSTANHSPLMQPAEEAFSYYVKYVTLQAATLPVYANLSASPIQSPDDIRSELSRQLTRTVRWTESIQAMIAAGARTFVEIGNKEVLSGLIRRISSEVTLRHISDVTTLEAFLSS